MVKNRRLQLRVSNEAYRGLMEKSKALNISVNELINRFGESFLDVLTIFKKDIGLYITR